MTFRPFKDIISDILQNKKLKEAMIGQSQFEPVVKDTVHSNTREKRVLPGSHNRYIDMKHFMTSVSTFFLVSSKPWFVIHKFVTKCLVCSLDHGGLLSRLFVIDYRASLSSSLGQTVNLSIMFSVFGLTAGIVYWQAETHFQIITAYCGASIPSLLFLSSVLLNRINRSLEVSGFKGRVEH